MRGGLLKLDTYFPKKLALSASVRAFKTGEKCFYVMIKVQFVLKIFKILPQHFWSFR